MIRNRYTAAVTDSQFSPLDIPQCKIWYDFADPGSLYTDNLSTVVTADGDAIYAVYDKSGTGNNAIQTTAGSRPLYKTSIYNNLSVARFDGSDDRMIKATLAASLAQPNTILMVFNMNNLEDDAGYLFDGGSSGRHACYSDATVNPDRLALYAGKGTSLTGSLSKATLLLLTVVWNTTATSLYYNGVLSGSGLDVGTQALGGISIGDRYTTAYAPLDGDICEFIVYNSKITDYNKMQVENYLACKWNIYR